MSYEENQPDGERAISLEDLTFSGAQESLDSNGSKEKSFVDARRNDAPLVVAIEGSVQAAESSKLNKILETVPPSVFHDSVETASQKAQTDAQSTLPYPQSQWVQINPYRGPLKNKRKKEVTPKTERAKEKAANGRKPQE